MHNIKIAVTAASGHLGVAIVKAANRKPGREAVIGISRHREKAAHLGVEIRKGDYNHEAEYVYALNGAEVILPVSGMDAPDRRIEQHRNVIRAARQAGVRKMVYTGIFGKQGKCGFDPIIAGIYEGIRTGAFDVDSDYRSVTGQDHHTVAEFINLYKLNH